MYSPMCPTWPFKLCVPYFISVKGAIWSSGEYLLIRRERYLLKDLFFLCLNKLNKLSCFHDRINKLTLKDNTVSYCFSLFICGGPCHLSGFKRCSGDLIFTLRTACLISYGKMLMSVLVWLIHFNIVHSQIMCPARTGSQDAKQTTDQSSNIWTTNSTEQINHLDVEKSSHFINIQIKQPFNSCVSYRAPQHF